jgi:hypothetical protein
MMRKTKGASFLIRPEVRGKPRLGKISVYAHLA